MVVMRLVVSVDGNVRLAVLVVSELTTESVELGPDDDGTDERELVKDAVVGDVDSADDDPEDGAPVEGVPDEGTPEDGAPEEGTPFELWYPNFSRIRK